ncbi:tRNA methyltransferase, has a role in tRNA modification [Rhizophlyctis rosea]|uniref:tRNA methyltransferase, has a role in tRNA modification n=1 Tax=Rhizophlyctis rosea TaxID=64517 RepID=A0AAD5S685_9FUNG|nr:tRNA methyltransferase, has a role in tRNA modification [Rhizophlyctis rosea]
MPTTETTPLSESTLQEENKTALEQTHVHNVYNVIADHFSATRYKPWPVVDTFLKDLEIGSIGADVGCGNGKYLGVNQQVVTVGSDRSDKLIAICRDRGFEAMVCDNLSLPYRESSFDFVLSIAVIHHFSSPERRIEAINELLRILRPGGKVLIFVWAMEQKGRRKFEAQDVFVPWHMPKRQYPANIPSSAPASQDSSQPASQTPQTTTVREDGDEEVVYQRYYHLFVKGELDDLVIKAGGAEIVDSGYDRDNWYIIARKT